MKFWKYLIYVFYISILLIFNYINTLSYIFCGLIKLKMNVNLFYIHAMRKEFFIFRARIFRFNAGIICFVSEVMRRYERSRLFNYTRR